MQEWIESEKAKRAAEDADFKASEEAKAALEAHKDKVRRPAARHPAAPPLPPPGRFGPALPRAAQMGCRHAECPGGGRGGKGVGLAAVWVAGFTHKSNVFPGTEGAAMASLEAHKDEGRKASRRTRFPPQPSAIRPAHSLVTVMSSLLSCQVKEKDKAYREARAASRAAEKLLQEPPATDKITVQVRAQFKCTNQACNFDKSDT